MQEFIEIDDFDNDAMFAELDRIQGRHTLTKAGDVTVSQTGKNSHIQVIDLRNNTGNITLNFGTSGNPVVLE